MIKSIKYGGTVSHPKVTIKGSGFGTLANLGTPVSASGCGGGTGSDYHNNALSFVDHTQKWHAGDADPCPDVIGLIVTTYSDSKIVFKFGSSLAAFRGLRAGDLVTLTVLGVAKTSTATL